MAPIRELSKRLLLMGSEIVLAIALALMFFLVFMGMLGLSFPKGTGLTDLYGQFTRSVAAHGSVALRSSVAPAGDAGRGTVARLDRISRRVKDRPASAIAWKKAHQGMLLEDGHTVQTFARSGAAIAFEERSRVHLGEKSLVVVKRAESRKRSRRDSLVVLGGEVRGSVDASPEAVPLEIVTAAVSSTIQPGAEGPADFTITVNPDSSSTVSVLTGTAEVTAEGRTALVEPNQSITVHPSQPPGVARRLPDPPALVGPANGEVLTYASVPPQVSFNWAAAEGAEEYRVVIARDPEFEEVVHTERTSGTRFVHGNLEAGSYYWKAASLVGHAAGRSGPSRSLQLVRDETPPQLRVALPEGILQADRLTITGITEPGARIFVDRRDVPVEAGGGFEHVTALRRGPNLIVIEAIDGAGNIAYHSQYVNAKF